MSYVDLLVQRSVQALDSPEHEWEEMSSFEFTDPVSRITDEPETNQTSMGFRETEQFIDKMTTNPKERRIAEDIYAQQTPGSSAAFQAAQAATGLTTGQFVRKALAKKGMDYVWGGESRAEGGWDCSGLIVGILRDSGYKDFPRLTAAGLIDRAKSMSVKKAINTRGALLWHDGHIAISLGNGKTIEAMNSENDITIGSAEGRFTRGGMLSELTVANVKRKPKRAGKSAPRVHGTPAMGDPLNKIDSVSKLNSASIVFGGVWGDVQYRPATTVEWDQTKTAPGLHFVPKKFRSLISEAAEQYGLSAKLIATVMQKESGFDPKAVSSAGAQGLMQVMPLHGLDNPFNPRVNIMAGARILASYIERMGSLRLGLAAYNAGPTGYRNGLGYADAVLDSFYGRN